MKKKILKFAISGCLVAPFVVQQGASSEAEEMRFVWGKGQKPSNEAIEHYNNEGPKIRVHPAFLKLADSGDFLGLLQSLAGAKLTNEDLIHLKEIIASNLGRERNEKEQHEIERLLSQYQ